MRSFTLTVDGEDSKEFKRIEFDAHDLTRAFHLLERESAGKTAILWEGETRLATLKRTPIGVWQLSS